MLSLIVSALPRPPVVCVHCEFVGGFGTKSVDVGGQSVEAVVFEGFVTVVGIIGTDGVARCVVVVSGGMAQRISDGFGQPLGVVAVSCGVTSGGDDADEVVKESIFHTISKKVSRSSEKQKPRAYRTHSMSGLKIFSGLRLARSLSVSFENYIGYGLLLMKEVLLMN